MTKFAFLFLFLFFKKVENVELHLHHHHHFHSVCCSSLDSMQEQVKSQPQGKRPIMTSAQEVFGHNIYIESVKVLVILNPNQLHVDIFRFGFHLLEVYFFIDSSKMISNSPEVSNFNRFFSNSTSSLATNHRFFLNFDYDL